MEFVAVGNRHDLVRLHRNAPRAGDAALARHDPKRHGTAGCGAGDQHAGRPENGADLGCRGMDAVDAAAEPTLGQLQIVLVPGAWRGRHGVEILEVRVQYDARGKYWSGWRSPSALGNVHRRILALAVFR